MKNLLLLSLVFGLSGLTKTFANTFDCSKEQEQINLELKFAKDKLHITKENEQMFEELAGDAAFSNKAAVSLFVVSGVVATGGMFMGSMSAIGGGTSSVPMLEAALAKLASNNFIQFVIAATPGVTAVGLATGEAIKSIGSALLNKSTTVEDLLATDADFDYVQKSLDKMLTEIDLDYPAWTDFLGYKDRSVTEQQLEIAYWKSEVDEKRVAYLENLKTTVDQICAE